MAEFSLPANSKVRRDGRVFKAAAGAKNVRVFKIYRFDPDSAENRKESRGAQAREDFPNRDDQNWMKHSLCWVSPKGATRIDYRPVHLNTLTDEVESIPPKARTY